ncbi:MAG: hypothetical protein IPG97_07130 [Microthrixaceae bacterium]|nr:hypothetical protein [Microthrixaceae bacterium]
MFPFLRRTEDVYRFDRADRMVGVSLEPRSTVLGGLLLRAPGFEGQVTTVTGTGVVAGRNQSWSMTTGTA